MNTQPNPKFSISAKFLGPVFDLDEELTKYAQNLIFARNGTGKSFLSRAFRYLDLHAQGKDIADAAHNLVSDEAQDGKGSFLFSRGTLALGELQLGKNGGQVLAQAQDTIFHVFSEDFVHAELREKRYELDGEIENQIAVDSDEIQLQEAQEAFSDAENKAEEALQALKGTFETRKASELSDKAGVNKQLTEYRNLDVEQLIARLSEKPSPPEPSFASILKDLDKLKALPSDPQYPEAVAEPTADGIDVAELASSLQRATSPSTVSEKIKKKIESHHEFYAAGMDIINKEASGECPFCEQNITQASPGAVIDAYTKYFSDEEEQHKKELREFYGSLNNKEKELMRAAADIVRQKSVYDKLRDFIPSLKDVELQDCGEEIEAIRAAIASLKSTIEKKAENLSAPVVISSDKLASLYKALAPLIEENNLKSSKLTKVVDKADEERKSLQRSACGTFEIEFAISLWEEIKAYKTLLEVLKTKSEELAEVEKTSPKTDARARVADTFELLLKAFFNDKYVFDKDTFVLKRGDHEMSRGPHRTLSDGEKTAIAFCYFVASIHKKVGTNSDYQRLFLVFDDPVTSMSYDFVFAIAQTLKNLSISNQGDISINPSLINGNTRVRPNLLILTHSSYFFNISRTNRVVNGQATFALQSINSVHKLSNLTEYIAPFQHQLRDIYEVANGKNPDFGTGNAVRSVLEAVGRFCRPDKTKDLSDFITFLAGEDGMEIKSVLVNNLSHGTYYEETPSPDDVRLACEEAVAVVEKYAAGQLELIKIS